MHLIGIFANRSKFEIMKHKLENKMNLKNMQLLNINMKNIENMKNISFETIVITNEINITNIETEKILSKICNHCKYIIMNADIELYLPIQQNNKINCITYGLNQKSTITISSVQEEKALIYIQREIKNIKGMEIEMGELSINLEEYQHVEIEILLAIYSIYLIYHE